MHFSNLLCKILFWSCVQFNYNMTLLETLMCFCSKIYFHIHVNCTFSHYIKFLVLVRGLTFALSSFECLLLYFTLFKSKLEYTSVVWNSILSTDANKLERIQQMFAALWFNRPPPIIITVTHMLSSSLLPHLGVCSRFWSIRLSFLNFLIRDSR
jgi:hypothetical protein